MPDATLPGKNDTSKESHMCEQPIQKQSKQVEENERRWCLFLIHWRMKKIYKHSTFHKVRNYFLIFYILLITLIPAPSVDSLEEMGMKIEKALNWILLGFWVIRVVGRAGKSQFFTVLQTLTALSGVLFSWVSKENIFLWKWCKALCCLKVLLVIEYSFMFRSFQKLVSAMINSTKLFVPFFFLIYIYALVGFYLFSGIQFSRCRHPDNLIKTSNWTVYEEHIFLCGIRECPQVNGIQYLCLNPLDYDVSPNYEELNKIQFGYGLLAYNTFVKCLLNTGKNVFLIDRLVEGYDLSKASFRVYYLSFIFFVSYFYVSVLEGMLMANQTSNALCEQASSPQKCEQSQTMTGITSANIQADKDYSSKFLLIYERQQKRKKKVHMNIPTLRYPIFEESQSSNQYEIQNQNKTIIRLEKYYYLPFCLRSSEKFKTLISIAHFFPMIVILVDCLNLIVQHQFLNRKILKVKAGINIACMSIFAICLVINLVIYEAKIFYLNKWIKQNKMKEKAEISKLKDIPTTLKIQIVCMFIMLTEVILFFLNPPLQEFFGNESKAGKLLQSIRYLRIIILFFQYDFFQKEFQIIKFVWSSICKLAPLTLMYFLILLNFSLIGFTLFADSPRNPKPLTYNTIYESIIFVFLAFYNEDTDVNMYKLEPEKGIFIVFFQVIVIIVGKMILSKYYSAMLMKYIEEYLEKYDLQKNIKEKNHLQKDHKSKFKQEQIEKNMKENVRFQSDNKKKKEKQSQLQIAEIESIKQRKGKNKITPLFRGHLKILFPEKISQTSQLDEICPKKQQRKQIQNISSENEQKRSMTEKQCSNKEQNEDLKNEENSFIGGVKKKLQFFLKSWVYLFFYIILTMLSVAEVSQRSPLIDPSSEQFIFWTFCDKSTTLIFFIDMGISLWVFGLKEKQLRGKKSNILNVIISLVCLPSIFMSFAKKPELVKVSCCKLLRLYIILAMYGQKERKMKYILLSFSKLLPRILKFIFLLFIFYLFFALLLFHLYVNQLYYCHSPFPQATIISRTDCYDWGGDWIQYNINTNSTLHAFILILMTGSGGGWLSTMMNMSNIKGLDLEPEKEANKFIRVFFIIFFFIGNMIIMNVFIGLSLDCLKKIKQEELGETNLTKPEKEWLHIRQSIEYLTLHPRISIPSTSPRYYFFKLCSHPYYRIYKIVMAISFLLAIPIIITLLEARKLNTQFLFMTLSLLSFFIELIAFFESFKRWMVAYHVLFALYVIVFGFCFWRMELSKNAQNINGAILMAFLFFRYWIYFYQWKFFRKNVRFIQVIYPNIKYTLFIIIATFLIYTCLGIQLFAYLRPNKQLNEFDHNYSQLSLSVTSLAKFATSESPFEQISDAAQERSPNWICQSIESYADYKIYGKMGCGSPVKSFLFFTSFQAIFSIILMPALVASIFDAYSKFKIEEDARINEFHLDKVKQLWLDFDPDALGFLPYHHFWRFVSRLHKVYKISDEEKVSIKNKREFLRQLNLNMHYHEQFLCGFEFKETILALSGILLTKKYGNEVRKDRASKTWKKIHSSPEISFSKCVFKSEDIFQIILLRRGMRNWKRKVKERKGVNLVYFGGVKKMID